MSLVEKLRAAFRDVAEASTVKVEFGLPPKVQFEWDGKSINAMYKTSHIVSYEIVMSFTDRYIFYEDLSYIESHDPVTKLREAEENFAKSAKEILTQGDPGRMHLASLFHTCIPLIADCRRKLEDAPGPESLKVRVRNNIPEMRSKVIPRMEILASFLPADDDGGKELASRIARARATLSPEQLQASLTQVRVS
jgi:hypothetical protein